MELIKDDGSGKEQAKAEVVEASFCKTAAENKENPEPVVQEEEVKTAIDDSLFSCIKDWEKRWDLTIKSLSA